MTPPNPYRTALLSIGVGALIVGVIVLLIALAAYNRSAVEFEQFGNVLDAATWSGPLAWGSAVLAFGAITMLLWLALSSVAYRAVTVDAAADAANLEA